MLNGGEILAECKKMGSLV